MRGRSYSICPLCNKEISNSNIKKHLTSHEKHPEYHKQPKYSVKHDGLNCQYCGKECKNANSLCNHERLCSKNPSKQMSNLSDYHTFGQVAWNKGLTKETSESVLQQSESLSEWFKTHIDHIGGYVPTSARKCKYGTYKGFYCDSGWELAFLIYNLDNNISIHRCTCAFEYTYENKLHKYYSDFIIDGVYYEIKGIYRPEDAFKIEQFPSEHKLIVIDSTNIYKYVRYCELTYGKDYTKLYDRNHPSWMNKHDPNKEYNFNIDQNAPVAQLE